jgi:hypothetical protein
MKRGWFGPKRFGWGASPASWEGWVATLVFVIALIGVSLLFRDDTTVAWNARGAVFAAYLAIVVLTYSSSARSHR